MKISSSTVQMASDYSSWEGGGTELASRVLRRASQRGSSFSGVSLNNVMDSVTLQSRVSGEIESTYAYSLHGESRVSRAGDALSDPGDGNRLVQRLVSGVVGREVTLTKVEGNITSSPLMTRGWRALVEPGRLEPVAWVQETLVRYEEEQVGFTARGQVDTADGRRIDFQLDLSMDRSLSVRSSRESLIQSRPGVMTDPLVISLDGRAPELTDTRFEFDLDSDGDLEEISFVSKGSGFLAFDKNGDGRINDGSELFGPESSDGFTDLAVYDQDQNGWIDENDAVFEQLSVWTRDAEGKDTLISLKEAGVGAIFLGSAATPFELKTAEGETRGQVAASGVFLFEDGGVGAVQEIDLAVSSGEKPAADITVREDVIQPLNLWKPLNLNPLISSFRYAGDSHSPYKDLLDTIEALKEKIRRLMNGPEEDWKPRV